jgi:Uma2 family endonuclease
MSMQELTLRIDEDGDLTPDISVFPTIHFDYGEDRTRVTEPPLIAVEIASPTQSTQELVTKCRRYVRAGVASVWLVQPALQTVTVFHDDDPANTYNRDETLVDPATDIKIDLAEVFRPPPDASEAKPEG